MFNHRFNDYIKRNKVQEGKDTNLEKGDIPALIMAAFSVFVPVILLFIVVFGIFIWLFFAYFH